MRDDLIARLEAMADQTHRLYRGEPETIREAAAALTAQVETAPATDHTVARTKLREWVQEDAAAAAAPRPAAEELWRWRSVDDDGPDGAGGQVWVLCREVYCALRAVAEGRR